MAERHKDATAENHRTPHRRSLLKYVRLTRQRASGGMEHRGLTNRATKKLRPLLLATMIVLSIAVVGLHVIGGFALLKTGMSGLSLRDPLAYVMIGLFAVVAILKLTHVVGVMHRKEKREDAGEE